jgi:methyl-accepting chemotaxis protein
MKKSLSLKFNVKLILSILLVILTIYITIFAYMSITMPAFIRSGVEDLANNNAARYSNLFKAYISEDMRASRMMADVFETYVPLTAEEKMKQSLAVLQREYKKHPYYRAVYTSWERKYVDPNWNKDYGRIRISLASPPKSDDDYTNVTYDTLDVLGDNKNGAYFRIKINRKDFFSDPYEDDFNGKMQTVATVASAVVYKGKFLGATGIDIPLSRFAEIISKVKSFYGSNIFLISNNGTFVGNKKKELIGKSIYDVTGSNAKYVLENINKGIPFSFYNDVKGHKYYVTMSPLNITGSDTPWMIGVTVPDDEIINVMLNNFKPLVLVIGIGLLIVVIVLYYMSNGITKPIIHISKILGLISKGEISEVKKLSIKRKDEIGGIVESTNSLVENLKKTAEFAQQIGVGNLDTEYTVLSENDLLGNSLINMRESLKKSQIEEDKRREFEERQNWATTGFAKFGELLRNNTDNMEVFTYDVISNLVKYTDSNQGAIFLLDDEDTDEPFLTMTSCYAYDRQKYVDKKIDLGSNLVGQCFLEADTIYMTDVPDNYVSITSGLGDANPRAILIVPLKFNDKVFGVIEMASFTEYEDYKIKFIEKLAESIASTISTVKVNMQTVKLLEDSKMKSEELASQEEEMRQNLEELQTTQEESARRELDMNGILEALNSSYIVIELDISGNIININENAKRLLDIAHNNVEGQNLRSFLTNDELDDFETLWTTVISGETVSKQHKTIRGVNEFVISESYTPVYNDVGDIVKILNIGVEIKDN